MNLKQQEQVDKGWESKWDKIKWETCYFCLKDTTLKSVYINTLLPQVSHMKQCSHVVSIYYDGKQSTDPCSSICQGSGAGIGRR